MQEHNDKILRNSNKPVVRILSINSQNIETSLSDDVDIGLSSVLNISINTRVMLRTNLWVEGGLSNGTMGTVKNIVYAPNTKSPALSSL